MKPKSIVRSLIRSARRSFRRRPRIIMTLLCRNEEDIVGYNIAYHLVQGVDYVIATDNASQDRTPLLLERFARQGKLHLIREPSLTHDQGTWVTRMARMAVKRFDADWIINSDADEFWLSQEGSVRDALASVPPDVESLAVPSFDMTPPRQPGTRFFEAMATRLGAGGTVHGTSGVTKACHRAYADVRVAEGNHHVNRRGVPMPRSSDHPLQIVHYPVRSPAQFERKICQGAEALGANPRLAPSVSGHWRRLYSDYLMQGRLSEYYDERAPTLEQITAGLADGRFVEDTRIRDRLRAIDPTLAEPDGLIGRSGHS